MPKSALERTPVTRSKRDFGTIRKRSNGRWQAYYVGLDQNFHRAPSTFTAKVALTELAGFDGLGRRKRRVRQACEVLSAAASEG